MTVAQAKKVKREDFEVLGIAQLLHNNVEMV